MEVKISSFKKNKKDIFKLVFDNVSNKITSTKKFMRN